MNNQFKNRLVGVTIFGACVIIFLPFLINGKKEVHTDKFVAIPIRPTVKKHTVTLDSAKKNLVADDNMQIAKQKVIKPEMTKQKVVKQKVAKQEKVIAKKKRSTDEKWQVKEIVKTAPQQSYASKKSTHNSRKKTDVKKALPTDAWTIQLGAFKKEKNINTLLKTLNRAGFQVHTMPLQVIDGQITRIFVGTDVSKSKLEKELPALKKLTKLTGHLVRFDAVNR